MTELMTGNTRRVTPGGIVRQILNILEKTAIEYEKFGDAKSDLRDAPEYLLTVDVAQGLARIFPPMRYRLEQGIYQYAEAARNDINISEAVHKNGARFDIVLIDGKSNTPRHVIEIKRGAKILSDAKRIIQVAALNHGRRHWHHAFIATVVRRTPADAERLFNELQESISTMASGIDSEVKIPSGHFIHVGANYKEIGKSRVIGTAIYAIGFHISLNADSMVEG